MKRTLTLLLAIALALPAAAQDEKRKLVLELVDAMGAKALTKAALDLMLPRIEEETLPMEVSEQERPAWEAEKVKRQRSIIALRDRILSSMNHERFAAEVFAPALQTAFSTDELREMTALLKTPAGQKLASALPHIFVLVSPKGAAVLERERMRVANEMMQEDRKKYPWKVTVADMRGLAVDLDTYAISNNKFPEGTLDDVKAALQGDLYGRVPEKDVWGTNLLYVSNGRSYRLVSAGADRQFASNARDFEENPSLRESNDPGADIIMQDGVLVQVPSESASVPTPQ